MLGLIAVLLTLAGCIGGSSPKERFYMLEPLSGVGQPGPETEELGIIGLRPVKLPAYLDRPQIVRSIGKNTYQISEFHRWAESLEQNITRVLVQNLMQLVPARIYLSRTSSQARQAQVNLAVTLFEFHIDPQGMATMSARWTVTDNIATLSSREMSYQLKASNTDYGLMVAALNECVNQLSRDIAQSLRKAGGGQAPETDPPPDATRFLKLD